MTRTIKISAHNYGSIEQDKLPKWFHGKYDMYQYSVTSF